MASPLRKRRTGWLLGLLLGWVWVGLRVAEAAGTEVLVIYNSQSSDSEAVARHYAQRRSVPESQLLGLRLPQTATVSRADYVSAIQEPLRKHLVAKGLAEWVPDSSPLPPGAPLRGHGWMPDSFEQRSPRREWLDEITGDRPMYLFSADAHDSWFNTAAMRAAGIGPDTPDPDPGAQYWVRDPDGTPTGHAVEGAATIPIVVGQDLGDLLRDLFRAATMRGENEKRARLREQHPEGEAVPKIRVFRGSGARQPLHRHLVERHGTLRRLDDPHPATEAAQPRRDLAGIRDTAA